MTNDDTTQDKATGDVDAQTLRDTAKRTTPPGNADLDTDAQRAGEERLEQAGGGH